MPTALVTGTNRGIGLELVKGLQQRGFTVIAGCRTPSDELVETGAHIVSGVDVTKEASLQKLAQAVPGSLDVLINNAGIMHRNTLDNLDVASCLEQFEVNALGPLRTTLALLDKLPGGSKVAVVTSRMGSVTDNTSGGAYGYRMSKAAVNMGFTSLAHDLRGRGIAVAILHPGWVQTDMTGGTGHITPAESAGGLLARIDALTLETTGTFWHQNGEVLPW